MSFICLLRFMNHAQVFRENLIQGYFSQEPYISIPVDAEGHSLDLALRHDGIDDGVQDHFRRYLHIVWSVERRIKIDHTDPVRNLYAVDFHGRGGDLQKTGCFRPFQQMLNDYSKMGDKDYRATVFLNVFGNPEGELVLDWLEKSYKILAPDLTNPNDVYYRLGRQSVITHIRTIIDQAKGKKDG